ncbi:hypothetical protein Bca4012_026453 [Brassica carinata]
MDYPSCLQKNSSLQRALKAPRLEEYHREVSGNKTRVYLPMGQNSKSTGPHALRYGSRAIPREPVWPSKFSKIVERALELGRIYYSNRRRNHIPPPDLNKIFSTNLRTRTIVEKVGTPLLQRSNWSRLIISPRNSLPRRNRGRERIIRKTDVALHDHPQTQLETRSTRDSSLQKSQVKKA